MFQDFETSSDPTATATRVARVREVMRARRLDALLVPRADRHQGEYVPPSAERLAWLTGFTGSAGAAVIAERSAALFVDGRYTVQVRQQADASLFEIRQVPEHKPADWLTAKLRTGGVVGFDPWLHTAGEIARLKLALGSTGIGLRPTRANIVDRVWGSERPHTPLSPLLEHPLKYAGTSSAAKLEAVQAILKAESQDAAVLTLPDSIAWLLNIRGSDVAHNPIALAFALVPARGKVEVFVEPGRIDKAMRAHLAGVARAFTPAAIRPANGRAAEGRPPSVCDALLARLKELRAQGKRVRVDAETAAHAIVAALGRKAAVLKGDPCIAPKARKVAAEIKGARAAHVRDGIAVARFLAWIEQEARDGAIDEIQAVRRLEEFRRASNMLRDISFDTIAGSGPNGAIVHYRVTTASNRKLQSGELFLIDSGGQYLDGTTDITRTIAIGGPTEEMRQRYTAVLKGHVAIATARFPAGTRGVDIDALARSALWQLGLDYDHGTGHGVGSYLSVHEGPASISKRGMVALEPGMILSNEPGYYKHGAYGIRIENLVLVTEGAVAKGGERSMLGFETLTLAPYDRHLIVVDDLTRSERAWIDAYHARVFDEIGRKLAATELAWLRAATLPL